MPMPASAPKVNNLCRPSLWWGVALPAQFWIIHNYSVFKSRHYLNLFERCWAWPFEMMVSWVPSQVRTFNNYSFLQGNGMRPALIWKFWWHKHFKMLIRKCGGYKNRKDEPCVEKEKWENWNTGQQNLKRAFSENVIMDWIL